MQKLIKKLTNFLLIMSLAFAVQSANADGHAKSSVLKDMPSGEYKVDLTHASILWKVSHFGFSNYVGRFTDFTADLNLDTKDFSNSSVTVDIKVASIDTAYPYKKQEDFDKKLSEKWLLSKEAPSITFKSSKVSALDGNKFTFEGDMSMAGQTHPVVFEATINGSTAAHPFADNRPLIGFSAKTKIDRTKWGVSKYAPKIGADVTVEVEGEFVMAK